MDPRIKLILQIVFGLALGIALGWAMHATYFIQ